MSVKSSEPTSEELLSLYVGGSEDAFAALYTRHSPAALAIAKKHSKNQSDAEDISQEAWLRMAREASGIVERNVMFQRALTRAVVECAAKLAKDAATGLEELKECIRDTKVSPERQAMVNQAVERLGSRQRKVFSLTYHGYTIAEISTMLNVPIRTVERRLAEARESIGRALKLPRRATAGDALRMAA